VLGEKCTLAELTLPDTHFAFTTFKDGLHETQLCHIPDVTWYGAGKSLT
jgi:hypothetical protein